MVVCDVSKPWGTSIKNSNRTKIELLKEQNPSEQSRLRIFFSKEILEGRMISIHSAFVMNKTAPKAKSLASHISSNGFFQSEQSGLEPRIAIIHLWNVPGALQRPKGMLRFQAMARLWDCNTFMRAASPGILKYIRIMTWKNNLHGLEVVIGLTIRIASRRKNVSSRDQHSASSIPDLYEFRKRSASISSRMKITTLEWSEGGRSGINKSGSK
ncbi:hypothetical protein Tco_0532283 [Tanacetum coccineum]